MRAERLRDAIGCGPLLIKDEGINPTSTFKARGQSTAVSKAKELGVNGLTVPSAGNAGGALAAYAARAGMEAHVVMPADAPEATRKEVEAMGARLTLVDGLIGDAGALSRRMAAEHGLFDVSTLQEPYRAEGKKTMGYEIAEQMGWRLPDVIVYPTGGGTGIVGIWKAIQEMETMGLLDGPRPRMFCVQAEGCAPMVRAFHSGTDHAEPWENARTIAAGMRVPSAIGDYLILGALRESKGGAITVSDDEIVDWMGRVSSLEGIFVCPEGAATAAALSKLIADGLVAPDEQALLLNTGSGVKYLETLPTAAPGR
jgi:threonine synthase